MNMSAYQVEYKCLGRILKAISKVGVYGPRFEQIEKLKDQYNKNAGKVFDQLLNLNRFSLAERYPEDSKELHFEVDRSKAVWLSRQLGHNDYQLLKSLNCYLYQSCEGDASKSNLYKTLREISNSFAHDLASKNRSYDEAEWS